MTGDKKLTEEISGTILKRLRAGFPIDEESLHFLKTSHGVNSSVEILNFLNDSSLNDGTIYELAVYPDKGFRTTIEKIIPREGIDPGEIESVIISLQKSEPAISLILSGENFFIDCESCPSCIASFVQKLNLNLNLQFLGKAEDSSSEELYYRAAALLRGKKFLPYGDKGDFMKRLVQYTSPVMDAPRHLLELIESGIPLLSGAEEKAFDALAAKKLYYESAISQAEEYNSLLKTWGMEFLMMRRIQPAPISVDEAIENIRIIDRLTSMVYGLIIPPSDIAVQIRIESSDSTAGIFN